MTTSAAISAAALALREAEVLLVGAGAGMGVDYRATVPHAGFALLRRWAEARGLPTFVFTSKVDGQFQKAGFDPARIVEVHGSLHHLQCAEPCTEAIWENREEVTVDLATMRSREVPRCPRCRGVARPNILMFGDFGWIPDRSTKQGETFETFLEQHRGRRTVIVEMGAGKAIPSVRRLSERIARQPGAVLVRINPRDADGPPGTLSIPAGALEGLSAIEAELGS